MSTQTGKEKNPPIERGPKTDNANNAPNKSRDLGGINRAHKAGKLPGGKR